jgi:hypothetical protein
MSIGLQMVTGLLLVAGFNLSKTKGARTDPRSFRG